MTDNQSKRASRLVFGVWIACAVGVVLAIVLLRPGRTPEPEPPPRETAAPAPRVQGEYAGPETPAPERLDKLVRRVDYALLQALLLTGYGPDRIEFKEAATQTHLGEDFFFQVVNVRLDGEPERFLSELEHGLEKWSPGASLVREGERAWTISLLGRATHQVIISGAAAQSASTGTGRLALVIDDLGRDLDFARELAALEIPVTFSILPQSPHGAETADLAAEAGREIILHQPMEPVDYPEVDPGPGALLVGMSPREIRSQLAANLALISKARGVNNHTGSRFTQIEAALAPVMRELGERGLFFLDSLTTNRSTAGAVAKRHGLAYYRRSIFLDNVREEDAILRQLDRAERMARLSSQAIAIGHPYPETLAALKAWRDNGRPRVRVVAVSELVPVD
jgi:polysaccharide deacetylase 2 family uncharacterized protein YibQ